MSLVQRIKRALSASSETVVIESSEQREQTACTCGAGVSKQIDKTPYGPKRTVICGACGAPAHGSQ